MIIAIVAFFGLIIGSFLNMVIYRLKNGGNMVFSRSKCTKCHHVLGASDLVPLFSFLWLRARCRYCGQKISWQYPLVELATALIFILGYFKFLPVDFGNIQLSSYLTFLLISSVLIVIFVYDLKYYLILDRITLPAIVLSLLLNFLLGRSLVNLMIAALIGGCFFLLQFVLSKGKWIGGGDIRLGLLMGAILGWPMVLVALFLSYISGASVGIILIVFARKKWNSQIPFGTFLSACTILTMLYGDKLLNWYLSFSVY